MAKLLMVVTGESFYQMTDEHRRAVWRQMRRHMQRLIDGESLAMIMLPGTKVQLFKVESDGVEELQSVTVRYEDHEGNEIEVGDEINRELDGEEG